MGPIQAIFLRVNFADNHGVPDLLALVEWDVLVVDKKKGISSHNLLCAGNWAGPMP